MRETSRASSLRLKRGLAGWLATSLTTLCALGQPLPTFDFTNSGQARLWQPTHHIGQMSVTSTGLVLQITGQDPYITGPANDYPAGADLWLCLRIFSEEGGGGQVFYYSSSSAPSEAASVRFHSVPGVWEEVKLPLPPLGSGFHLRLDPPGTGGYCTVERLWFEKRMQYASPDWPKPGAPTIRRNALLVRSGMLELRHNRDSLGSFQVSIAGQNVACGNTQPLLGWLKGDEPQWLSPAKAPGTRVTTRKTKTGFTAHATFADSEGGHWSIEQEFSPKAPNAIVVETRVSVDRDRDVLYLPMFTLLAGIDSFGTNKAQGLLAGLEYLENEPSSSTLDVRGDAASRLVPDRKKVTIPLMAVAAENRCLGLAWEPQPDLAPVFDSPDRQFNSGGHLLSLILPGSDGFNRKEDKLLPYAPLRMRANAVVAARATIFGVIGNTVIPAVRHYVMLNGLPPLPAQTLSRKEYLRRTAESWLNSGIVTNALVHHALWPGFNPQPAADAAVWTKWLAEGTEDPDLSRRLSEQSAALLEKVPERSAYNSYSVGHVRYPFASLVFGSPLENAARAKNHAESLLNQLQPDGTVLYRPRPGATDLGTTHYSREANGLAAALVWTALEEACFSGDPILVQNALAKVQALSKFRDTVPRGAQTWEVPLHTPDILASAHLVRCYLRAYQLTGHVDMLEQARYWAWTGVPFVYLSPPVPAPVGLYGTIPVFGATEWVGHWFGRPVQWCGLVYSEALFQLAEADPSGPWHELACGIAASGTQQIWPPSDTVRQGLLPDFYLLQQQVSDGPAINPGTLQSQAMQFYDTVRPCSFRALRRHALLVHAAGSFGPIRETETGARLTVTNWPSTTAYVLFGGLKSAPEIKVDGRNVQLTEPNAFDSERGLLALAVKGTNTVELTIGKR